MMHNKHSSPITLFDEDSNTESETEASSCVEWLGPENQLGLEQEDPFGVEPDDEVNVEIEKGEIKP